MLFVLISVTVLLIVPVLGAKPKHKSDPNDNKGNTPSFYRILMMKPAWVQMDSPSAMSEHCGC